MAQARRRENWEHTSALLALTANIARDPKKSRSYKPRDFNPYSHLDEEPQRIERLGTLKHHFTGEQ